MTIRDVGRLNIVKGRTFGKKGHGNGVAKRGKKGSSRIKKLEGPITV